MTPELVSLLAALVSALPGLLRALTPEAQASVREQLAHARTLLPPAGSVASAVEAVITRHGRPDDDADTVAYATGLPRADVVRVMRAHAQLVGSPLAPPVLFAEPDSTED